jgi:hypothetical protein
MKVISYCGYYPDRAHKELKRRTEDYWNAYFYVWAIKVGSHKRDFYILAPQRINITKTNFGLVRKTFGKWASEQIPKLSKGEPALIPVPSKDGLVGKGTYRSLDMVREAFAGTKYARCVVDGLRWNRQVSQAHVGGARSRDILLPLLNASKEVKGNQIILIDELFSTGGSLLACADCLTTAGAKVLGAITCGKTIYNFDRPAFGTQEFELTAELADWPLA